VPTSRGGSAVGTWRVGAASTRRRCPPAGSTSTSRGFLVEGLDEAAAELEAAGAEIVLPLQDGGTRAWLHFRAPDGFVYERVEERSA
jgi:hypothetical protein